MRPSEILTASLTLAALAGSAVGQIETGDLLVNLFDVQNSTLEILDPDGASVATATGDGAFWEGVVVTASGMLATTSRMPHRVRLFETTGLEVGSFDLLQVDHIPGDIGRFGDGTLVVVDQGGEVELYVEDGTHVATWTAPEMTHPFAVEIDQRDHLWVADIVEPQTVAGYLFEFDRAGTLLQTIVLPFEPGDLVVAPDGTLWINDRPGGIVHHLSADGTPISSFASGLSGYLTGIVREADGSLVLAAWGETRLARYDPQGVHLGDLPLPATGNPVFLEIAGQIGLGVPYCFGAGAGVICPCGNLGEADTGCANSTGRGAALAAQGSTSLAAGSLSFEGRQLVPRQPAQLLAGKDAVQGGAGLPFGDGLRCAGTDVRRLGVVPSDGLGAVAWGAASLPNGAWVAGDTRYFQAWYRDPTAGPCGTGLNLTNGVKLTFTP